MRCREAKRRINRGLIDTDLETHLRECVRCARFALSREYLDYAFREVRNLPSTPPSALEEVREKIENQMQKQEEFGFMARVRNEIGRHPAVGLGAIMAAFLLIVVILVPFSYHETIGYTVTYQGVDSAYQPPSGVLPRALQSLGYREADVVVESHGDKFDCQISNLYSSLDARKAAAAFAAVTGYDGGAVISPVVHVTSATLYAQVKDKVTKIEIDTKDKSDDQIQSEIELKLKEEGINSPVVNVRTRPDGMHEISVGFSDSSDTSMIKKDFEIVSGEGKISFDASHEITVDTKDKTDDEIKAEIQKQMKEKGIENADVKVRTDEDGKRNIEVKIEKEKP